MPDEYPSQGEELPAFELVASSQPSPGEFAQASGVVIDGSTAVQVGDNNIQYNSLHVYGPATWTSSPPRLPVTGSPYYGLRAFEERDKDLFFGRDAAVTEVVDMLSAAEQDSSAGAGPGIVIVSGVSGAGKSSLLHAGMLPRLRRSGTRSSPQAGSWPCLLFTPGRSPLDELAAQVAAIAGNVDVNATRRTLAAHPAQFALLARHAVLARRSQEDGRAAGRSRLLLVIDQFEQLFTQCQDEAERRAFITALHSAATDGPAGPSVLVVIGVRADFEARCAEYPELTAAFKSRRCLLTAMTDRELELAITGPAMRAGARIERELVDRLREEIRTRRHGGTGGSSAGVLPLLSYALAETWRLRRGPVITLGDYHRTGGIEAAVEIAAERAYRKLSARQQEVARLIFLRLTATSSDGTDTAVPATYAEFAVGQEHGDVRAVLDAFAAERLLVLTADGAQISHEALLTAWPLLRDSWLEETRADRALLSKLCSAVADWVANSSDGSYLWSGALLESALATAARMAATPGRLPSLTRSETRFLASSKRAARRGRRWRQALGVMSALILVAAVAGVVTVRDNAAAAADARAMADSEQLAAGSLSLDGTNPVLGRLEALAAWRLYPSSAQADYAMLKAAAQPELAYLPSQAGEVEDIAFSRKGNLFATITATAQAGTIRGEVQLWNAMTRLPVGAPVLIPGLYNITPMAFNDAGTELAIGVSGGTQLWKASGGRLTLQTTLDSCGGDTQTTALAFMPGGAFLAVGDASQSSFTATGCVQLWDTVSDTVTSATLTAGAESVSFSSDGHALAVGTSNGASLWDTSGGHQISAIGAILHGASVGAVAFSPKDLTLATGSTVLAINGAASVQLWNAATLKPKGQPFSLAPGLLVNSLAFSPDGRLLAEGANGPHDGPAHLWNVETRQQASLPLAGSNENSVNAVSFDPHQPTLAVVTGDGTKLWNAPAVMDGPAESLPADIGADGMVGCFGPGGTLLAVTDPGASAAVLVLNAATRRTVAEIPASASLQASSVRDLAFSSNGSVLTVLSVAGSGGSAQRWQLTGGTAHPLGARITFTVPTGNDVAGGWVSPDGSMLIVPAAAGLELWNLTDRDPVAALFGPKNATSVQFGANGDVAVTTGGDTQLWNVTTRRPDGAKIPTGGYPWTLSPDGKTLAVDDGTIAVDLWDTATGEPLGVSLSDNGQVFGMAFSANGEILATVGNGIQLWDIATGQRIGTLPGGGAISFDPAGTAIAIESEAGLHLWDVALTPGNASTSLCAQAGQTLSTGQWAQYARGVPYQSVCPSNPS